MAKKKRITDAVEIMNREFGNDPATRRRIEHYKLNMHVAQLIYDARDDAGLTQKQLAELVGTRKQVITRLEDADYEGQTLSMLRRIGEAVGLDLEIRFVAAKGRRRKK